MNLRKAKVYFDGSCWIAIPHTERPYKPRAKPPILSPEEEEKKEEFEKSFNEKQGKRNKRKQELLSEFSHQFKSKEEATAFVEKHFNRLSRNRWERYKRMMRRAYNYQWNYFATFTYDDKKQTEESFRKTLMNTLYHLANRKGWKYMGAWERGELGERLHFHALIAVPEGQMVGELEEHNDYSTKRHQWEKTVQNSFFNERFGRSEFQEIDSNHYGVGDCVSYMLKYITKNDEKVVYSRGLKTYIVSDILDDELLIRMGDEQKGFKYILPTEFTCIIDGEIIGMVSPEVIEKMPKSN